MHDFLRFFAFLGFLSDIEKHSFIQAAEKYFDRLFFTINFKLEMKFVLVNSPIESHN